MGLLLSVLSGKGGRFGLLLLETVKLDNPVIYRVENENKSNNNKILWDV